MIVTLSNFLRALTLAALLVFGALWLLGAGKPVAYSRALYSHWRAVGAECADGRKHRDARHEVLARDSRRTAYTTNGERTDPLMLSEDGCEVLAGLWIDKYTSEVLTLPAEIQIDHRGALKWVHERVGYAWTPERRAIYANDLTHRGHLVVTAVSVNTSKGAKGPAEWAPDLPHQCEHARELYVVVARYVVPLTAAERVALDGMLSTC